MFANAKIDISRMETASSGDVEEGREYKLS
jgi:hypothetical protein